MAEEKKPGGDKKGGDKKPAKKIPIVDWGFEETFLAAIGLIILTMIVGAVNKYFHITSGSFSENWVTFKIWFAHFFAQTVNTLTFLSIFFTMLFIMAAYYAKLRRDEIVALAKFRAAEMLAGARGTEKTRSVNVTTGVGGASGAPGLATVESAGANQWKQIEKYMQSNNQSDWRFAIMEADILLYDMLEQIGLQGETIGEKLKSVNSASFNTLDMAWNAHKVRNLIAHDGASYEMSYEDARRTIGQYKKVFDEFYFV